MRGLDGQARIFIGSSSEGRTVAETIASALAAAGMRPLLWSDFFKTRDLPIQELDRQMVGAAGAILVGSADDRLDSRGKEFDQMRDNVLFEYGLFAGHLGRHRCILLMPDHPRFRIPSDFLGVVGFEFYTHATLNAVAKKLPERLQAAFAADGFKPPSLKERCRRLLLLSGWTRGEIAKIRLELSRESLKEQFGKKIEAILCFLKEDIDKLGLREDATVLEELVRKSLDNFPNVPTRKEVEYQLKTDVRRILNRLLPSYGTVKLANHKDVRRILNRLLSIDDGEFGDGDYEFGYGLVGRWLAYRRLLDERRLLEDQLLDLSESRNRDLQYEKRLVDELKSLDQRLKHEFSEMEERSGIAVVQRPCGLYMLGDDLELEKTLLERACRKHPTDFWCIGAVEMAVEMLMFLRSELGEFDRTISRLDSWQQRWVPDILDRLGAMEQIVHKQIFGHL